jgi:hypothetical protein
MVPSGYLPVPHESAMICCDSQTRFDPGCSVVLELKCYTSFVPLWMVDLIRAFQLKRRGFSKYATCLQPCVSRYNREGLFQRNSTLSESSAQEGRF